MKQGIKALAIAAVFALVAFPAAATQIKLGTLAPKSSPWYDLLRDLAEAWKVESEGKVKMRIYAGGIAGDEPDMVRKLRIGQLHAAALTGAGLSRIANEVLALQIPMMFSGDEELAYVRERIAPRLEAILEDKGFKVLTWGDAGWVYFFTQKPAVHPEDFKDMKIFVWIGDTEVTDAYKRAGYQPVTLAATDIHIALQSGMIQAFPTTPIASLSFQWFGQAKNMTNLKWAPLIGAVVVSTEKWRKVPDDLKPRLEALARAAGVRFQTVVRRLERDAVAVMQQHGLTVHEVPRAAIPEWERIAEKGFSGIVGTSVPADLVAEVRRLRDEYRGKQLTQKSALINRPASGPL